MNLRRFLCFVTGGCELERLSIRELVSLGITVIVTARSNGFIPDAKRCRSCKRIVVR